MIPIKTKFNHNNLITAPEPLIKQAKRKVLAEFRQLYQEDRT